MRLKVTVDGVGYDVEVEVADDAPAPLGAVFIGSGFVPQHAAAPASTPVVSMRYTGLLIDRDMSTPV